MKKVAVKSSDFTGGGRLFRKIILFLLSLTFAFALIGCGGNEINDNELRIAYYKGGFGEEWAQVLARKFESENPGVVVDAVPDGGLDTKIDGYLGSGCDYDLIFCHNFSFETYAINEQIENLDDLYATDVGDGVTFEDRIKEYALESSKYDGHYYKVPWTLGTGGIAYNPDIMRRVNEKLGTEYSGDNMDYNTFKAYCADVSRSGLKNGNTEIVPFTWSTEEAWFWDFIIYEWWAQLSGLESLEQFKKFDSQSVYNPNYGGLWEDFRLAYTLWYDIIAANKNYSKTSTTKIMNQGSFVNGNAAMMPAANWVENECKGVMADGFTMRLMPAPTIINAEVNNQTKWGAPTDTLTLNAQKNGDDYIKVSYTVSYGDNVVIPKANRDYTYNTALAKKFLLFMQKEENCRTFTKESGGTVLPYKYDFTEIENPTGFQSDLFKINTENTKFHFFNQSPIQLSSSIRGTSLTSVVWPKNEFYYAQSYSDPVKFNKDKIFEDIWQMVQTSWKSWERQAGI